ncbi:MAG: response regulator [Chloroflexi bacterium]|nr:response regulator [Chloroflexota bacterium]MBI3762890.1 response regulator [Chloroflexota bacterium]
MATEDAPTSPGRVLVVDDDKDTLLLIGMTLQRAGYEVFRASSGAQALELLGAAEPDVIVLDIMMPEMNGLELLRRLQVKFTWPPPVVFLTAKSQISDRVQGLEAGAFRYLTKPSPKDVLLETVKEAVAEKRGRPRLTGRW